MTYSTILFDLDDGLARITLNRPERLNAMTGDMHAELADALDRVATSAARVLLLTGAGRGFCAGQDLSERRRAPGDPAPDLGLTLEQRYNPLVMRLVNLKVPVICAVNGVAAGAGANIALACDLVIATASARFIQSFANIGLLPDAGGTWTLPRLVGHARAAGLCLTGEPIDAATAASWGMIWRAIPDAEFAAETEALARKLAKAPTQALVAAKQALRAGWNADLPTQLGQERDFQRALGQSADYQEGVAAFNEKRPADFRGA